MKYMGNVTYHALIIGSNNGMDQGSRFVLNDGDFARLKRGLPREKLETQVLFKTSGEVKKQRISPGNFTDPSWTVCPAI